MIMYTTPPEIRKVYPWPERIKLIEGIINDIEDLLRAGYDSVVRGMRSNPHAGGQVIRWEAYAFLTAEKAVDDVEKADPKTEDAWRAAMASAIKFRISESIHAAHQHK